MSNKPTMDTRTREQIQTDTILTINELQDFVEVMFPWKISQNDNEIILSRETIQIITKYIKQLKENK